MNYGMPIDLKFYLLCGQDEFLSSILFLVCGVLPAQIFGYMFAWKFRFAYVAKIPRQMYGFT